MSKFLDEKQLCAELGISPVTTTKWRRKGEGPPFIRVGRLMDGAPLHRREHPRHFDLSPCRPPEVSPIREAPARVLAGSYELANRLSTWRLGGLNP